MRQQDLEQATKPAAFGRRRIAPRACIVDAKKHIRAFLSDALDDLGFVTAESGCVEELTSVLAAESPDLAVLGLSADGIEADRVLTTLADAQFDGQLLLIGARDSILATAARQLATELGVSTLPVLSTPFGAESLRDSVASLLPIEAAPSVAIDVAEALKAGWLELWYQQKIDARTLAPRGVEALVRMRHPSWGIVPPASFIPDQDDPNFRALSDFVIERALSDWRYFVEQHGPVEISINLPVAFFDDPQAVRHLCLQMPAHPAFGGLLIEVKSDELTPHLHRMIEVARQIRFHNIAMSIQDVGIEWPSLAGLDVFPFAELKVDRQFIAGCADDRLKQTVCRRILDLAQDYGARTVAEGVETRADFVAAREMGFDRVQGFLFGKPMAPRKFARATLGRPVQVAP